MRLVRHVATTDGRTVVATVHQPSAAIFAAFDDLLLLKPGGLVVFNGSLGGPGAPHLVEFVTSLCLPSISA